MKAVIVLAIIIAGFITHAVSLNFTQDDAFIVYRYVRNFVNGYGLVFNSGERVEGYTNFLWVVILSLFAKAGADVILTSKVIGIASGCACLILLYFIGLLLFREGALKIRRSDAWVFAAVPPILLTTNGTFAYWSISGLESTSFVMGALLTVYFHLRHQRLSVIAAVATSLIRPEGVIVFAILILHNLAVRRSGIRSSATIVAGFALLLVPLLAFRLLYYGDLLPNSFYAKTGLSSEYLKTGTAYFWLFLRHYGLYGVPYIVPLVFPKRFDARWKLIAMFVYVWTLYVIVIGGDVLNGHRFFTPVLPFVYLLVGFVLGELCLILRRIALHAVGVLCLTAALALLAFWVPRNWLLQVRLRETHLVQKMEIYGYKIREAFGSDCTLATTTIGAISYVSGARVIDMLGLTDREIAKNPERIPGIASTWKEKNFNTQYLMARDPDIILFSTGGRPSAPAEKALYLSSQFRCNYYPYYFYAEGVWRIVYRRKGEFAGSNEVFPDPRFVDHYSEAVRLARGRHEFDAAIERLEEVIRIGPPDFAQAYELLGFCYLMTGDKGQGRFYLEKAVGLDEYLSEAQWLLYGVYLGEGKHAAAADALNKVREHNPERILRR